MNVIFVNTLEKKLEGGQLSSAQVTIGESHGVWHIAWNNQGQHGKPTHEEWYQGNSWEELLQAFRAGLKDKFHQGYHPLIQTDMEAAANLSGKSRLTQMLVYYSEMNPKEEVYESLRLWRREQAAREGKAPFILATNRMLGMISVYLPQTEEELRQIPGFGEQKAAKYAPDIIKFTGSMDRETAFPLDWVARSIDMNQFEDWVQSQRERKKRMEMDKEENKRKLLELVATGLGLDDLQKAFPMSRRELLQYVEELDREGYDLDPLVEAELAFISEEEQAHAWRAFETAGDRYLKPVLHTIFAEDELKDKDLDRVYEWLRLLRLRFRKDKESFSTQAS